MSIIRNDTRGNEPILIWRISRWRPQTIVLWEKQLGSFFSESDMREEERERTNVSQRAHVTSSMLCWCWKRKGSQSRTRRVLWLALTIHSLGSIWVQNWRTYRFQEFDLIHRCLCVMFCTLHHLHSNKPLHPVTTEKVTFASRKRRVASGVTV